MAAMPRAKTQATKIAYKILGKPANMQEEHLSPKQKSMKRKLVFEATFAVR
jgi:hypothetical protein